MNTVNLIKDIYMYFARFPQKEGVQSLFVAGQSSFPQYAEWKNEVDALPPVSLIPEIKHYIFGVDRNLVVDAIKRSDDFFLFVDYGEISATLDDVNRRRDSFHIAYTVAYPMRDSATDIMERNIISDMALDISLTIRQTLIAEEKCRYWLKDFKTDHIITPWVSEAIPSYGWTTIIDRQGFDMLQGR